MTSDPQHSGLTFRTLDADDDPDLVAGWYAAVARGFHEPRDPESSRNRWLEHVRADRVTLRGVWQEHPVVGAGTLPVATFSSWDKTINVGGGRTLPVRKISDVTVSPTHRRQGLLRALMGIDLGDAVAERIPLAALLVSEGSIYGRFGFGAATFVRRLEVDTTARFRLRGLDDDGSMVLVEPAEAAKEIATVFADFHASTRGSVDRTLSHEQRLTGVWNYQTHAPDTKLHTALHLDAGGRPDGYAVYQAEEPKDGRQSVTVGDLVATTPAAYLRLWQFLADLDLVHQVTWRKAPVEDPLFWALVEPFAAKTVAVEEFLWVRVLDVVTALEARPWGADGTVVIEVDDPLGHAAGRFRVTVSGGRAEVTPTDAGPDVTLAADTLGSLYLGGVPVATLAAAGRIGGSADAVARWAALCDVGPTPYCITGF